LGNINFLVFGSFWLICPNKAVKMTLKRNNERFFSVAYYHDVELNAGARDASSTCAITVTLTSSSKAV